MNSDLEYNPNNSSPSDVHNADMLIESQSPSNGKLHFFINDDTTSDNEGEELISWFSESN
mgnify:CR=1 FL=1